MIELEKENEQLKQQIEQLSNDNHVLKTAFITQQAQIEKMKCCENCKNHYWNYGELDCRLKYSCYNTNYDKWELAE